MLPSTPEEVVSELLVVPKELEVLEVLDLSELVLDGFEEVSEVDCVDDGLVFCESLS